MYISSCPTLKKPYNTDIHVAESTRPKAYSYVRFSTPEQENGDSLRRQLELSKKFAKTHGLDLDDSLRLTDRGLSAFNGLHRTKGTLGQFLKLVEQGEIPKGCGQRRMTGNDFVRTGETFMEMDVDALAPDGTTGKGNRAG